MGWIDGRFCWLSDFLFVWGVESVGGSLHDGSLLMNHFGSTKNQSFEDESLYLWGV